MGALARASVRAEQSMRPTKTGTGIPPTSKLSWRSYPRTLTHVPWATLQWMGVAAVSARPSSGSNAELQGSLLQAVGTKG